MINLNICNLELATIQLNTGSHLVKLEAVSHWEPGASEHASLISFVFFLYTVLAVLRLPVKETGHAL